MSHPRILHRSLAVVAALTALSALAGAAGLVVGFLSLDDTLTARLPADSPVLGGLALAVVVAVPNAVVTALAARRDPRSGPSAIGAGVLLVLWILVELAFIREFSFFHPLYVAIGLLLVWLGLRAVLADAPRDQGAGRGPRSRSEPPADLTGSQI